MTGSPEGIPKLVDLAASDGISGYVRLKAVEALGRLRASAANEILQKILEARQVWRWQYPSELRIAAGQALLRIDPVVALSKISAAGFDKKDMVLEPIDPEPNSSVIRQRRYARLKLSRNLTLVTTNIRENFRLSVPELNLGGGIGAGNGTWRRARWSPKADPRRARHQGPGHRARCAATGYGIRILWKWTLRIARACAKSCWNWADCRRRPT